MWLHLNKLDRTFSLAISYVKFVGDFGLFFLLRCGASKAKASRFSSTSRETNYFFSLIIIHGVIFTEWMVPPRGSERSWMGLELRGGKKESETRGNEKWRRKTPSPKKNGVVCLLVFLVKGFYDFFWYFVCKPWRERVGMFPVAVICNTVIAVVGWMGRRVGVRLSVGPHLLSHWSGAHHRRTEPMHRHLKKPKDR